MKVLKKEELLKIKELHQLFLCGDSQNGVKMDLGLLHNVHLSSMSFPDLINYDFYSAQNSLFEDINFSGINFSGINFSGSTFINCIFINTVFIKAEMFNTNIKNCLFVKCNLNRLHLGQSKILNSIFVDCIIKRTFINDNKIEDVIFKGFCTKNTVAQNNQEKNVIWDLSEINENIEDKQILIDKPNDEVSADDYRLSKRNNLNEFKKENQILSSHTHRNEKIELIYTGYDLGYRDSKIDRFKVISDSKKTIIDEFNSSINKRLNSFSFGYKNWIFIPETFHYYLYDISTAETFNQTVWFRENKRNYKDSNIGNYFSGNKHITINLNSIVLFNLDNKEKQIIKLNKESLGKFCWAYQVNDNIFRLFFKSTNKTALYNMTNEELDNVEIITNNNDIKQIEFNGYDTKNGNHIVDLLITDNQYNKKGIQFIEKLNS